jgi:hypothetical protein
VQDVASVDRPSNYDHLDLSEATLYTALTLNLHGTPYDLMHSGSSILHRVVPFAMRLCRIPIRMKPYIRSCILGSHTLKDVVVMEDVYKLMKW